MLLKKKSNPSMDTAVNHGGRRLSNPSRINSRRDSTIASRPVAGDTDLLESVGATGWRGLFQNGKCLAIAMFASLGGVLYGYNQVRGGAAFGC